MKKFELVCIPALAWGHLASMFEMANTLQARDHRLAVTLIAMRLPSFDAKANEYIESLYAFSLTNNSIQFIVLPELQTAPKDDDGIEFIREALEIYKPHIKQAIISSLTASNNHLVGFVLDIFCSTMIDVANEFEVPSYGYYTSGAGNLPFTILLEQLYTQNNSSNEVIQQLIEDSDVNLSSSWLVNQVPSKVISGLYLINEVGVWIHEETKRFRTEMKGILINTFEELESHVISSLSTDSSLQLPPLYSVGPILHLKKNIETIDQVDVLKWLDDQPPSSVVFLCFGSRGSFEKDQVEEIGRALEQSGVRFIWSLRQPLEQNGIKIAIDYTNFEDILPEGFLDRTKNVGRVIGWAPQVEILAHPATGGFMSHCDWNSTLESLWHGVPMATWPQYSEQQFNAFELVEELGLAVEISISYCIEHKEQANPRIMAEEIEKGIRKLIGHEDNEIRKKVKMKSEECRRSVIEGGSSFISFGKFIDDVLANSPGGEM